MKWRYNTIAWCFAILLVSISVLGQAKDSRNLQSISFNEYLQRVLADNLSLAAQKYEVDIAQAQVMAAKIMPDPELSFAWFDNQQKRLDMGYGFEVELAWDLELGGKRKARSALALDQLELTQLELLEFLEDLRAQSTIMYFKVLQNKAIVDIQRSSYESMLQIAQSDSIRFNLGQISQVSAVQSKLEASSMWNDLKDAEDELFETLLELNALMSNTSEVLVEPQGDFTALDRLFSLEELLEKSAYTRIDLQIAKQNISLSGKEIKLARAEKVMDLGLSLGVEGNSYAQNIIAPTPSHTVVKVGVSVPLKFSNKRESGVKIAQYTNQMSLLNYQELEISARMQIKAAYQNYLTKQSQISGFQKGMLNQAKEVYQGVHYSYLRGASSLLEVLEAQRTYNETQISYADTLLQYAISLVELERAVGIWDIDF